jgi:hypothetical protein
MRIPIGAVVALGLWVVVAAAQEEPTYRTQTEVTIAGTVTKLASHVGQRGTPRSRATLALANGDEVLIHIGPTNFVRERELELRIGDRVTVTGSRVGDGTAALVIVRRMTRGSQTLDLRNSAGRPLWEDRYR